MENEKVKKIWIFFRVPNPKIPKGPFSANIGPWLSRDVGVAIEKKIIKKWTKYIDKGFGEHLKCSNPISSQLTYFFKFTSYEDSKFLNQENRFTH